MINLKDAIVTGIQFFDYTHAEQISEIEQADVVEYSANVIVNDELVIQLSGKAGEAHPASVPSSEECHYNNKELQDWVRQNIDLSDIEAFLEENDIENNFHFLNEFGEPSY